jgi:LysM repeat protein
MPNQIQLINMVNEIADYNEIDNPNMIYSGQTIFIPNDISPSQDLVSGPTQWLKEQGDSLINRLEGLNDRSLEWRKDHQFDSQIDNARTIRV